MRGELLAEDASLVSSRALSSALPIGSDPDQEGRLRLETD